MKKLLLVLCCTALLLVGLFHVQFVTPTTAKPAEENPFVSPWQSARAMDAKMLAAKKLDSANAIKRLPGIADAKVVITQRPKWERNVWVRTQIVSVDVSVEAHDNRPIGVDTIQMIRKIVAPLFGTTAELVIFDEKFNKVYDGTGVETANLTRPDIGKFRVPIEYRLHNIPSESLINFLAEEFQQVETEAILRDFYSDRDPYSEWMLITASLTDHRTIMKILPEIGREIEAIGNEAASDFSLRPVPTENQSSTNF